MAEHYKAETAKLDYEERLGILIDAEDVKVKWVAVASVIRTKVLGIPAKAKQRNPEMTGDQVAGLELNVREVLEELSDEGP